MAFHEDDAQNTQQQPQRQTRAPRQDHSAADDGSFSFFDMGSIGNAPMGRTPAAEVLISLNHALAEVYKNHNQSYDLKLLPLDMAHNPDLPISVLVISATSQETKKVGVGTYALILEGSTEAFTSKFEVIGGDNVEIKRFADDAYDDSMRRLIEKHAAEAWPGHAIIACDATVIPRGTNIKDEQVLHSIASSALFAIHTNLRARLPGAKSLNLRKARGDTSLSVKVSFGNPNSANVCGMPVRSDIAITTVATRTNSSNSLAERENVVAKVTGFLDLIWNPVAPQQQAFFGAPQFQQVPTQKYNPHFIITSLDSPALTTLEAQLFALATVPVLAENNAWAKGFDRKVGGQLIGGVDVSDIGVLNVEANLEQDPKGYGARIDLKSAQYSGDQFYRFLGMLVRPELHISLDIEETGPETWIKSLFWRACHDTRSAQALLEAANYLTGNEFGAIYQSMGGNGRPVVETGSMIHLGYVEDSNGRRDIREVDYTAVGNVLLERDPKQLQTWSDSFYATNIPVYKRLSDRAKIIGFCEGGQVVYTGKAHRITFDPVFLQALSTAVARCNVVLKQHLGDLGFGITDRAVGMAGMGLSGGQTGMFSTGFGYTNNNASGFGNFGTRFG